MVRGAVRGLVKGFGKRFGNGLVSFLRMSFLDCERRSCCDLLGDRAVTVDSDN